MLERFWLSDALKRGALNFFQKGVDAFDRSSIISLPV
jgi:hypothetical protein